MRTDVISVLSLLLFMMLNFLLPCLAYPFLYGSVKQYIPTIITHKICYKPDGLKILFWLLNKGPLNLDWLVLVGLSMILHANYTP